MQPLHLGIFRSDYLLHSPEDSKEAVSLKQVEFNTISSSFGALSERSAAVSVQQPIAAPELSTAGCMQVDRNECRPPPEEPVQLDAATAFYYTSFVQS